MKEKMIKIYVGFLSAFIIFLATSVLGWVYEVLTIMLENHHGFQNRGVLMGPYLPIYGFGMLILIITVNPIRKLKLSKLNEKSKILEWIIKVILVFLAVVVVASLVELIASYIISPFSWDEKTALWIYTANENYSINFQGRIALRSSLRFGLAGTVLLYTLYPVLNKVCKKDSKMFLYGGSGCLLIFVLDLIYTYLIK